MGKILTDEEMAALEAGSRPAKRVLSDDEMASLEASQSMPREKAGVAEALVNSVGNASGFADELTALWGATGDTVRRAPDLESLSDAADFFDTSYGGWKSAVRKNDAQIREDRPGVSLAGDVAGGVMLAAVPGLSPLNPSKAVSAAGRIGQAAALGAGAGAGRSDSNITDDPLGLLADTGLGAGLGAGAQYGFDKLSGVAKKGVEAIGEKLPAVGQKIKDLGAARAAKAAGLGDNKDAGRVLLKEGVVGFGDTTKGIAAKAKTKRDDVGEEIGDLLKSFDSEAANAPIGMVDDLAIQGPSPSRFTSGKDMAKGLLNYADEIEGSGNEVLVNRIRAAAKKLEAKGDMSFADAAREKASWKWQQGDSLTKEAARDIKSAIGSEMELGVNRFEQQMAQRSSAAHEPMEQVESQFGEVLKTGSGRSIPVGRPLQPVLGEAQAVEGSLDPTKRLELYKGLKSKYGPLAEASKESAKIAKRSAKNATLSWGDRLTAIAGGVAAGPKGWALAGANKLARHRGDAAAAVTLDKVGDLVKAQPERFGRFASQLQEASQRGNHALAVTHFLLMSQNPEYRQLLEEEK